jgi:glycosyltransferase involved in cell wall biosynthesis
MIIFIDKMKRYLRIKMWTILSIPLVHWLIIHFVRRSAVTIPDIEIVDVVFVMPPANQSGWILEAICREIGMRLAGYSVKYCNIGEKLPRAKYYFFSHYMYYIQALSSCYSMYLGRVYIYATHLEPSKHGIDNYTLARILSHADGVFCMNSKLKEVLNEFGVPSEKLCIVVGAASCNQFQSHERHTRGKVGFSAAYYWRKSPDMVLNIIRKMPDRLFVLMGKGWESYPLFSQLIAQPNFEYVTTEYLQYAKYYDQMSVFVSVSQLEGGPIPLIEAMMSNVVPVVSRTGFAPDIIQHGENGFLADVNASASEYCELIEKAFEIQLNVRESVLFCDWDFFALKIRNFMRLSDNENTVKSKA